MLYSHVHLFHTHARGSKRAAHHTHTRTHTIFPAHKPSLFHTHIHTRTGKLAQKNGTNARTHRANLTRALLFPRCSPAPLHQNEGSSSLWMAIGSVIDYFRFSMLRLEMGARGLAQDIRATNCWQATVFSKFRHEDPPSKTAPRMSSQLVDHHIIVIFANYGRDSVHRDNLPSRS